MRNTICIFEDAGYTKLLPLVWMRGVYELKTGIYSLMDKIIRKYPGTKINLFVREYLEEISAERHPYCSINPKINDDCLFINGRFILQNPIPVDGPEEMGIINDTVVYLRLTRDNAQKVSSGAMLAKNMKNTLVKKIPSLKIVKMDGILITYFWDLIKNNSEQLIAEFKSLTKGNEIKGQIYENTVLLNKDNIYIGKNTKIKPGVVIDAEDGPVYISDDVLVEPNAVIQGPAFIGNRTIVRLGAKIRLNTSIGEVCRVGGEIEDTIIHSYSNKQHDGFLGHAYVGMWCNFGAGTTNSDLKNNYSNIKVFVEGKLMDSGSMFIGLIMSDHSKAAISTVFNSGTVVGVSSNIFGEGFPPKFIPSFSWGAIKSKHIYRPEDAIETAQKVMARRKKQLSKAEAGLLKHIFESTKKERKIMLYV